VDFTSDPWPRISPSAKDLVRKMLTSDPKKRISAYDVLSMFSFSSFCTQLTLVQFLTFEWLNRNGGIYLFAVQIILGSRKMVKRLTRHWTTLS